MFQSTFKGELRRLGLPTTAGVITVFDNALVYGSPTDALSYHRNRRGREEKFGRFRGFMIGEIPAPRTRAGVIAVFDNALVYGNPLNKREAFGRFRGFMIGEVPRSIDRARVPFEYIRADPKVELRKMRKRFMRRRRHKKGLWRKYHEKNPIRKFMK